MTERDQIVLGMDASGFKKGVDEVNKGLESIHDSATDVKKDLGDTAKAGEGASQSLTDFGNTAWDLEKVLGSLSQNGVGGAASSLQGLVASLTGPAGITLAVTAAIAAFTAFRQPIGDFISSILDGANEVPPLTEAVDQFAESLGRTSKELDTLREKQSLTNQELERHNVLLERQEVLEKALTIAKKQKAEAEKLNSLQAPGAAEQQTQRATDLQAEIGGKQGALVEEVRAGIEAVDRGLADAIKAGNQDLIRQYKADIKENAQRYVSSAVVGGDETSLRQVLGYLPKGSQFRDSLNAATPEGMAAADQWERDMLASTETTPEGRAYRQARDQEAKAQAKVGKPAPGRGAAQDAVRDMKRQEARDQSAALKATNDAYAAREKAAEKADADADKLNAKLAREADRKANGRLPAVDPSVTQRKAIGEEFAQRSAEEGVSFNPGQIQDAAEWIQRQMSQGVDGMAAMQQAFATLLQQTQMLANRQQQQGQWWGQAQQQAQTVPDLLNFGNW